MKHGNYGMWTDPFDKLINYNYFLTINLVLPSNPMSSSVSHCMLYFMLSEHSLYIDSAGSRISSNGNYSAKFPQKFISLVSKENCSRFMKVQKL